MVYIFIFVLPAMIFLKKIGIKTHQLMQQEVVGLVWTWALVQLWAEEEEEEGQLVHKEH